MACMIKKMHRQRSPISSVVVVPSVVPLVASAIVIVSAVSVVTVSVVVVAAVVIISVVVAVIQQGPPNTGGEQVRGSLLSYSTQSSK